MVLTMNIIKRIVATGILIFGINLVYGQSKMLIGDKDDYWTLEDLATIYKDAGKYFLADSIYNEMIPVSKKYYGESGLEYAKVLSNLGKIRIEQQLYAGVEEMLKTSLSIKKQVAGECSMEYAETLNILGVYYTFSGNIKAAETALVQASKIKLELKGSDDISYVTSLIDLGTLKFMTREFSEAEQYYKKSVELGCIASEPLSFGGLMCLSSLYATMGKYPEAKVYVEQYITAIRSSYPKEHPNYIAALTNLGGFQVVLSEYDEAEQTLLESSALSLAAFGKKHNYYIHSLSGLSVLYSKTGQYEKAESVAEKSLSISKALHGQNHPEIVRGLNNLAALYLKTGNYVKAIQAVTEAMEITTQTVGLNSIEYVRLSNVLANIHISKEEFEKAYPILLHADSLLATIEGGHTELELALLNNVNRVLFNIQSVEDTVLEKRLIEVIEKKKRLIGENESYSLSLSNLASFYDERNKHAQARIIFDSLLVAVERNSGEEGLLYHNILLNSSINYELTGDVEQAKQSFISFLELSKERVSSNFAFMTENERELYWKTLNHGIKRCQSFADRYKSKDTALAYLAYDCELFSKNLLLSSSQAVRQSILESNNKQLIADWNSLSALKNNPQSDTDTIRLLEKRLMVQSKEYQQLQASFSTVWNDVALSLADHEAAIEFITYEVADSTGIAERIYTALILRKNGAQTEIGMLTQCTESDLKKMLHSSAYDFDALYNLVWSPIDEYLHGIRNVYISPTGLLNSVPFAALRHKGKYLLDHYSIHTVLSSKDIISLKSNRQQFSNRRAILFGGADFGLATEDFGNSVVRGQGFDYLPGSRQEVEEIGKILSDMDWNVATYIDKNATETALKANLEQNAPALLHISTHGYYFPLAEKLSLPESNEFYKRSDNPLMRCGLLFSGANSTWNGEIQAANTDDGILTAYEISNLNLSNTGLIVLSACDTGLGDVDYSEGVYGLQRAFRLAGAKSMIVSLWKVSDKETVTIITEFYKNWSKEMDIKQAFSVTLHKLRTKHPDDPKNWAGFVMIE